MGRPPYGSDSIYGKPYSSANGQLALALPNGHVRLDEFFVRKLGQSVTIQVFDGDSAPWLYIMERSRWRLV